MFNDPLDKWLWATPLSLPKELILPSQTEALQNIQKLADLGASADVNLVDFWQEIATSACTQRSNFSSGLTIKANNHFHYERLTIATAALALIVIRREDERATNALRQLSHHPHPDMRELAIHYLGRAFTESSHAFPNKVLNEIALIATTDEAFEPRYQARRILQITQQPVPQDNPGGVYDLKVMPHQQRRTYRTIAIRAEQTLRDLQRFIQHAYNWDNEHLYSFYMNGRKYDDRYRFSCSFEEHRPPWDYEAIIGQVGLVKGHRFLYHFDYGNDHLFEIEVISIRSNIPVGNYPRLVSSHGKAPAQ